jgi:hypothetical protein
VTEIDRNVLFALVADAEATYSSVQVEIKELENALSDKKQALIQLRMEAMAMRSAYERRFGPLAGAGGLIVETKEPNSGSPLDHIAEGLSQVARYAEAVKIHTGPHPRPDNTELFEQPGQYLIAIDDDLDWLDMSRSDAVFHAVDIISKEQEDVSPADIENFLKAHGREDDRDSIGAALAYLNRNNRVNRLGRGRWVPARAAFEKAWGSPTEP